MKNKINGIILVNKERGVSSNKVVNKVKYLLNAEKAGHLGTLDVLGEGLLPVTLGKGTKLFDFFLNKDKVYKTIFKFGETTATLDLEGEITNRNDVIVSTNDIKNILNNFIGKQKQMPPLYSAKKINGRKAYELAREGKEASLKPKEIEIYSIKLLKEIATNVFEFEVHCSSGTYIRSLCRDIASSLSTFGVMLSIQRTKCGMFSIDNSFTIQEIQQGQYHIINSDSVFDFEDIILNANDSQKLLNGVAVNTNKDDCGDIKVYNQDKEFLGIGFISQGKLKSKLRLI